MQNQSDNWLTNLLAKSRRFLGPRSRQRSAVIAARKGDYTPLLRNAEAALSDALWQFGTDHPETARKLAGLAAIHAARGETSDAEPLYRRAVSILTHSHDSNDRLEALTLLEQFAELLSQSQDPVAAQDIYADLLSRYRILHNGRPNADFARILDNMALALKVQGHIAAAKESHRDALLIWEEVRGPGSAEVARCLTHLASLYLSERCYEEAEPLLLRAVAAWKSSPNPNNFHAIITLSCCGDLYRNTGRGAEARSAEAAAKAVLAHFAGQPL